MQIDRRLSAAVLAMTLVGCSGAPAPAPTPPEPAPAAAPANTPANATANAPANTPANATANAPANTPANTPANATASASCQSWRPPGEPDPPLNSLLEQTALGLRGESTDVHAFPLKRGPVPAGCDQLIAITTNDRLSLVAVDKTHSEAYWLAYVDNVVINPAKVRVAEDEKGQIVVVSQAPFSAAEESAILAWDGQNLRKVSGASEDPSLRYFRKRELLLAAGNLDGLRDLRGEPMYPASYAEYYTQPARILKLAHQQALQQYRSGDGVAAWNVIAFGVSEYTQVFGDLLDPKAPDVHREEQLPLDERVQLQNDYAFFMAEAGFLKEAEPLLLQVINTAPDRTVAYLNLADVQWDLGKQAQARYYYRTYLDRLGPNRAQAPARVEDRVN